MRVTKALDVNVDDKLTLFQTKSVMHFENANTPSFCLKARTEEKMLKGSLFTF